MNVPAQKPAVQAQPLIAVKNVRASSRWYAELLGADRLPEHAHRDVYDRIASPPLRTAFAVRTGNHHDVTVGIAEPSLPVPGRGVDVRFQDDLGAQAAGARHGRIEIIDLEPQEDTFNRPA